MPVNIGPKIGIDGEADYRKALKNIIQETKTLDSELKALSSSFDDNTSAQEKNSAKTELLKQKQAALTKEVEQLKKATDAAADKFGENSTECLKWKENLAKAEAQLNEVNRELKNSDGWATFKQNCEEASEKLNKVGTTMKDIGNKMSATLTVPIMAAGTAILKTSADFESAMSQVKAISGATGEEFEALSTKAREMGATTKFSASESAEAFKYMAMAGWETDDMLNSIKGVMNLAAASGEELGTVSDIVTDAMTAFGMSADGTSKVLKNGLTVEVDNATRFVDALAAASNSSNTNVALMGESFKYVAPIAGGLGYSVEDVAIALGLMANQGVKASMSGTSLRSILTNLSAPTDTTADAMEKLGISLKDDEGKMYSLMDVMEQLRDAYAGGNMEMEEFQKSLQEIEKAFEDGTIGEEEYETALDDLAIKMYGVEGAEKAMYAKAIAGKTGMSGLLAIVNTSDEEFDRLSKSIYNANGTCQEMADIMNDNLNGQIKMLKSKLEEVSLQLGKTLLPLAKDLVGKISEWVDGFSNLDENTQKVILGIAGMVAAIGPLLSIAGNMTLTIAGIAKAGAVLTPVLAGIGTTLTATVIPAVTSAVTSMVAFAAPFAPAAAAVGLVIAAGVALYTHWEEVKELAGALGEFLQEKFTLIKEKISDAWENAKTSAADNWAKMKETVSTTSDSMKKKVVEFGTEVKSDWKDMWENMKETTGGKLTDIKNKTLEDFEAMKKNIGEKFDKIKETVEKAVEKLKELMDFEWELPKLKMPHISISGHFSLNPPSAPTFAIDWYKKAMNGGMILNGATIFGVNSKGQPMGGGEAGPEAIVGVGSLYSMIQDAVSNTFASAGSVANNVTLNVYGAPGQDVEELADIIEEMISDNIRRVGSAW